MSPQDELDRLETCVAGLQRRIEEKRAAIAGLRDGAAGLPAPPALPSTRELFLAGAAVGFAVVFPLVLVVMSSGASR